MVASVMCMNADSLMRTRYFLPAIAAPAPYRTRNQPDRRASVHGSVFCSITHEMVKPAVDDDRIADRCCRASVRSLLILGKVVSKRLMPARLELVELAHEGRRDGGVELAVEEHRAVGPGEQRRRLLEIPESADGRGLEAETLGDRRIVDVGEHRLGDRQVAHLEEVQLRAIGA